MSESVVVLVHAPLVGPSTWRLVADELAAIGLEVVVPHLRVQDADTDLFDDLVGQVAAQVVGEEVALVGHSGAGFLLPFVAEACGARRVRLVFVDAGLPPPSGPVELAGADFRGMLDALAGDDGLLPPWHTWWGDAQLESMVPDRDRRAVVTSDVPQLPLSFFDAAPAVPESWHDRPAGYVLLSEVYRPFADQARRWNWPCAEVPGTHLETVNRPGEVAAAIRSVAAID